MTTALPDVAVRERPTILMPLDWVGMQGIDVPIVLDEPGPKWPVHAKADVQVDLPAPAVKGIHMSRLYRLLEGVTAPGLLSPGTLATMLEAMVVSHVDCGSTRARVALSFNLLQSRPALVTEGLSGWKAYPVIIEAVWEQGSLLLDASVQVSYSSTCPCSAALSRQLLANAFAAAFGGRPDLTAESVLQWLLDNGSHATPHSQRSVATVKVRLPVHAPGLGLVTLIDRIEAALGTPVQTAVKRADEQAFARLNGQHLMYVEDAARRTRQALDCWYAATRVEVRHMESLHPHDAVALTSNFFN